MRFHNIHIPQWHRIWAMVIRHTKQLPSDFNKLSSIIYWPFLDIVLMGLIGLWVKKESGSTIDLILLTNISLWQIVVRADFGVSLNLLEEIWANNIVNLFSTPLSISEWICATFVEGFFMVASLIGFCALIIYLFYSFNIFSLGWFFIPITLLNFFSGLFIGFLTSSLLIYWGSRVQALAWMIGWMFAPISGVYSPTSALPDWMQTIAHMFPFHYSSHSAYLLINNQESPLQTLMIGYLLITIYLPLSISLFIYMFKKSKNRGLQRLRD